MTATASEVDERGVGTIGTAFGFLVFVLLILTAVQVLYNLYATSMVTAAAQDAAHTVAGIGNADDRCGAIGRAEQGFRSALGSYATDGHARCRGSAPTPT
ncbi:MAG: hypothetical protein R2695_04255 [Acidimicrobiales bacterium]